MVDARSYRVTRCSHRFDQFVGEAALSKDIRRYFLDPMPFEKWLAEERASYCQEHRFSKRQQERSQRVSDVFLFSRRQTGGRLCKAPFEVVLEVAWAAGSELEGHSPSVGCDFSVKVVSQKGLGFKRVP